MPYSNLHIQKRRTNRAILIALFAFCALLFILTLVKMTPATGDDIIQLTYDVPLQYQSCTVDSDCVLVSTTCNGCCDRGAIHRSFVSVFGKERDLNCKEYEGPVCNCIELPATTACVAGYCTFVSQSLPVQTPCRPCLHMTEINAQPLWFLGLCF